MLDPWKWIVLGGATHTIDIVETVIEKNLVNLRNVFGCFRVVLPKHVSIETITNEYTVIHKSGYLCHKEYKYSSPPTAKCMAVFISSKRCAFME